MLTRCFEMAEVLHRRAHQEAVAFREMRSALPASTCGWPTMTLCFLQVSTTRFICLSTRVLVLARIAELLAEIAFADQDRADALHLGQHLVEVLDAAHVLDLQDAEDLAVRIERPDVGLL